MFNFDLSAPMQILTFIFFGGAGLASLAINVVIWRLDWILLHEHPALHREWQLGMLWIAWWKPSTHKRLRDLEDARITKLLDQERAISIFAVAMICGFVISAFAGAMFNSAG